MRNFDLSKVYQPSPRQQAFHNSKAKYRLYGGAVGGGKTHAIVFEAIGRSLAYDFPVSGAIFRRSFPELDSTIVRKMQEILPPWLYKYNQQKHVMTFSNGSTIDFGYAETDGDVTRYQSREWDWLGIDELTHFTEYKFTYLMSRVRTTKDLDVKFFAGTNPGDVGHTWVKSRWIDKDCKEPGYNPDEYDFISAKIQDNKFIMEANPDYIKQLEMLPENQRRALLYGDWDVFEGQFFEEWDEQRHVVKPFKVPGNWRFIMSMDDGTRAPRSAHVWAIDNDRRVWCVWEYYRKGEVLPDAAENMKESLKNAGLWNKIEYLVVDPSMKRANDQTGLSGTEILEGMGFGFKYGEIKLGNNKRVDGWKIVKSYLAHKPYQEPMLKFFSSCENIVRTIPNQIYYVGRNSKKEDLDTTQEDHAADDCRYALTSLDMLPSRFETGHGGSFEVMGRKYSPIHK